MGGIFDFGQGDAIQAAATIAAAELAANAQKAVAEENRRAAQDTIAANRQSFLESRGSGGNAFLPLYAGNTEAGLFSDYNNLYKAGRLATGTPAQELARYQAYKSSLQPAFDSTTGVVNNIFNDKLTAERLGFAKPTFDARTKLAGAQKGGIYAALSERLNALNASDAAKGFSGTGSFSQNRLLGSTIGAEQAAAGVEGQAALANASQAQSIQDAGQQLKLQSLNLPYSQLQAMGQFANAPTAIAGQNFLTNVKPYDYFRLGIGQFTQPNLPQTPVIPSFGQILATGVGGLAANYNQNKNLQQQLDAYNARTAALNPYPQPNVSNQYNPYAYPNPIYQPTPSNYGTPYTPDNMGFDPNYYDTTGQA